MRLKKFAIVLGLILILFPYSIKAEDTILLGCSAALSGHAGFLGQNLVMGMKAYFNYINDQGGINGKKIKLVVLDDQYDPPQTVRNTQKFINEIKPLALIGYVGTPTTVKILNMISNAHLPLIGPFTGAHQLRCPYRRYVFNIRNSYWAETEALVEYAVEVLKKDKIAVFYENDAYGLTGYKGTVRALAVKYNKSIIAEAVYTRGKLAAEEAVTKICKAKPEVVIMIGAYAACSDFIKRCKRKGLKAVFMNISFVGPTKLAELLGPEGNGVIVSQVVPPFFEENLPAVKEYKQLMHKYFPEKKPSFVGLEGFIDAKVMVEALRRCHGVFSSENLVKALESFKDYDPGIGATIDYGPHDREGLDIVYLTQIQNGRFKLIKKVRKQIHLYVY